MADEAVAENVSTVDEVAAETVSMANEEAIHGGRAVAMDCPGLAKTLATFRNKNEIKTILEKWRPSLQRCRRVLGADDIFTRELLWGVVLDPVGVTFFPASGAKEKIF